MGSDIARLTLTLTRDQPIGGTLRPFNGRPDPVRADKRSAVTYSLASARKWCNDSEFALVTASFGGKAMAWAPAILRAKIERTRKLRDKNLARFRQILRTNRASIETKLGKDVTAMAVAEKRAKLFGETLARSGAATSAAANLKRVQQVARVRARNARNQAERDARG